MSYNILYLEFIFITIIVMKEHTSSAFLKLSFHYNWEEEILDSVPDGSQQFSGKKKRYTCNSYPL